MESGSQVGWECVTLADLVIYAIGGDWGKAPDTEDENYVLVRCIRASEMKNWARDRGETAALRKIKHSSLSSRELKPGDIILEVSGGGPEQPVGRTVLIDEDCINNNPETPKICTNFFRLLRSSSAIDSRFLNQYLQHFHSGSEIKRYQGGSNNLRNLRFQDYLSISVPLPPLGEQRRIITKIEELFSKLDKAVESLQTARAQLKTYRQSLLKAAFEGRLTEQWRRDNADKLETADRLLQRIREERDARYQQQLEEWKFAVSEWTAEGRPGRKPRKPVKPKWVSDVDEEEREWLGRLPSGWTWSRYGNLCQEVRNGISKAPSGEHGDKIFRISAVRPMAFDMSDYRFLDNLNGELDDYTLLNGDIVFTRYNGSRSYVGVSAVFRSDEKFLYPDKLIRTRLASNQVSPYFIEAASNSGSSRRFIETRIRTTAGQSGVSGTDIKMMPVPLCSLAEQNKIVELLDQAWSRVSEIEGAIEASLSRAVALRQSILKRAFEGNLVPQDPNDELASVLLERIREEQAAQPINLRRKRKDEASA